MTLLRIDFLIVSIVTVGVALVGVGMAAASGDQQPAGSAPNATSSNASALSSVVASYAAAWGEPDRTKRQQLLERVFAADGTYTDPTVDLPNRAALVEHIDQFLKRSPGSKIEPTSVVDTHHGSLRFAWRLVLADGKVAAEGLDFGELTPDGRIKRIVGFFGPLQSTAKP